MSTQRLGVALKGATPLKSGMKTKATPGKTNDWGKTQPFWCLNCGEGFPSVERVLRHYSAEGHGNDSMSIGSRGLTKKQQLEAFRLRNK